MTRRDFFSHDSPEGHDFSHRYRQAGYTCQIRIGRTIYGSAENIADRIEARPRDREVALVDLPSPASAFAPGDAPPPPSLESSTTR
jgi:hypothetical protein